jgi:hypothetical protein
MQVEAALSQEYEEPLQIDIFSAQWALQLTPSSVLGLKLLPAAQEQSVRQNSRSSKNFIFIILLTILPTKYSVLGYFAR